MKIKLMKKNIFIIILLIITVFSQAQKSPVLPDAVKTAFHVIFIGAESVKWEKTDSFYTCHFIKDKKRCVASFSPDGQWQLTEIKITKKEIPPEALAFIKTSGYSKYHIKEVSIYQPGNQLSSVKITLKKRGRKVFVFIMKPV